MIRLWQVSVLFLSFTASSQSVSETPPLMGRTTGALPYLEYGLGTDRLGGAKMGYLDTGIVMRIVDSTFTNYKVQLSKHHVGFVPKNNLKG